MNAELGPTARNSLTHEGSSPNTRGFSLQLIAVGLYLGVLAAPPLGTGLNSKVSHEKHKGKLRHEANHEQDQCTVWGLKGEGSWEREHQAPLLISAPLMWSVPTRAVPGLTGELKTKATSRQAQKHRTRE